MPKKYGIKPIVAKINRRGIRGRGQGRDRRRDRNRRDMY